MVLLHNDLYSYTYKKNSRWSRSYQLQGVTKDGVTPYITQEGDERSPLHRRSTTLRVSKCRKVRATGSLPKRTALAAKSLGALGICKTAFRYVYIYHINNSYLYVCFYGMVWYRTVRYGMHVLYMICISYYVVDCRSCIYPCPSTTNQKRTCKTMAHSSWWHTVRKDRNRTRKVPQCFP